MPLAIGAAALVIGSGGAGAGEGAGERSRVGAGAIEGAGVGVGLDLGTEVKVVEVLKFVSWRELRRCWCGKTRARATYPLALLMPRSKYKQRWTVVLKGLVTRAVDETTGANSATVGFPG